MIRIWKILLLFAVALYADKLPDGITALPNGDFQVGKITVRRVARELALPGKFNLNNGALEVVIARPEGRVHEALLVTEASGLQIQAMLYALGAKNGQRLAGGNMPQGTLVDILIEWKDNAGKVVRQPVEEWILDGRTNRKSSPIGWVFVGSAVQNGKFQADVEGNIAINYSSGATILDLPDKDSTADDTLFSVNPELFQPTDLLIIIKPRI